MLASKAFGIQGPDFKGFTKSKFLKEKMMVNIKEVKVSKYNSIYTNTCEHIFLSQVLENIKNGEVKERVLAIRELYESGKQEASNKEKSKLPAIVFSTLLDGKRSLDNIREYTGVAALDVDNVEKDKIAELKSRLALDSHVLSVFLSPRHGLRILVRVDSDLANHKLAFKQLSNYFLKKYGIEVDKQTSDANRLNFCSYDSDIYINEEAVVFHVDTVAEVVTIAEKKEVAVKEDEKEAFEIVNEILAFLKENDKSITSTHEEWYKVAFALAKTFNYELGQDLYIKFCELDGKRFELEVSLREFDYCYEKSNGSIGIGTIIHLAQEQGFCLKPKNFWFQDKKGEVGIDPVAFLEFLNIKGFYNYVVESGNTIIRIKDQVLEAVDLFVIKQCVTDYIKKLPINLGKNITSRDLLAKVIKQKNDLFNKANIEFLPTANPPVHRDSENECFIYYKNGPIRITKDSAKIITYGELDGSIWKNQILSREVEINSDYQNGVFSRFIKNVCNDEEDRILSLKSAIGFLIHRYKDPIQSKAIVFGDEKISDNGEANGGTGKSLVGDAISKLRKVVKIDGKNFGFGKFAFQQIDLETDIVQFDDVRHNFEFEALYSGITTGINVEKKGETPYVIPFEMAPKFEINTNYTIKGTGGNTEERRKFVVEFSDYYGENKKPSDEFGHRFFKDWSKEEWLMFDNFMIHCVQIYLTHGLVSYEHRTLKLRNLIGRTSEDFVAFANTLEQDVEYELQDLQQKFIQLHPAYRSLSQRRFCKWIREFIQAKNLKTYAMVNDQGNFQKKFGKQYLKIVEGLES